MYRVIVDRHRAVSDEAVKQNMAACAHLPVYSMPGLESGSVAICAAGPSLLDEMEVIKSLFRVGVPICAVKGVTNVLIENGIIPKYAVFMDPQDTQARFLQNPHPGVEYLMCTQTHPDVMRRLEGFNVTTWHGQCYDEAQQLVNISGKEATYIHGPTTGVAAINLMRSKGYAPLNLFGFDCSYRGGVTHVYDKVSKPPMDIVVGGRKFSSCLPMIDQHNTLVWLFSQLDTPTRVYGDGAFQHSVRMMSKPGAIPEDYIALVERPFEGSGPVIEFDLQEKEVA